MPVNPLQYRLDGPSHAPVVLLVPPFGARMSVWEPQMPELTRSHRVLRIDHRGHGGSAAPPGPYRIEDLALDLLSVLDAEGITRVSAVGASLSSSLLVWIAVNSPRTIDRLALLAPAPRTPRIHGWGRIAERARNAGMEAVTADVVLPWFTPDMYEQSIEVATALADDVAGLDPEGFASVCEAVVDMDQRSLFPEIKAPTLVVSAAHDPLLPPGHGRRLADGIADVRFEIVPGAAHLLGVERPDRVNELLLEHITS